MAKAGRPSIYNEKLAQEICARLADGESLRKICRDPHMPARSVVLSWAIDLKHPFSAQYAMARDIQADTWADEIVDIADETDSTDKAGVMKGRLQVDTRKWIASKLKPKKYSEKIVQEHVGKDGGDLFDTKLSEEEMIQLAQRLALKAEPEAPSKPKP